MGKYSKRMRKNMTKGEKAMCSILESLGFRYKSQEPYFTESNIGGFYIVDFVIPHIKTIIEIDGEHHKRVEQLIYDDRRDRFFQKEGFTVLRYLNERVLNNKEDIKAQLLRLNLEKSRIVESEKKQVDKKKINEERRKKKEEKQKKHKEKKSLSKQDDKENWKWKTKKKLSPRELIRHRKKI